MDYEMIKTLAKIVNEAEVLKKMARDALNSIPIKNYEEYIKYYSAKSSEKTVTSFSDCHISDFTFPHHIDEIKKDPLSVQEYCKMNRCWAAKDSNGKWYWYRRNDRPHYHYARCEWLRNAIDSAFNKITNKIENVKFPDVLPDKSLIAPDGRLILIEGKKQKKPKEAKFKAGKWYRSKRNSSIIHCQEVLEKNIIRIDGLVKNGTAIFCVDNLSDWYEMKHYKPNKKKKKSWERGEPIFVWELNASYNIPAMVKYFHSFSTEGVFAFDSVIPNGRGLSYPRYRKYDPRLVGVPRKDWEDMPYA